MALVHGIFGFFLGILLVRLMKVKAIFLPLGAVVTGGIFFANAMTFPMGISLSQLIFWQALSLLFLASAFFDLFFRSIPLVLGAAVVALSLAASLLYSFPLGPSPALLGALVVGGLVLTIYGITKGKGIGEADILFGAVIGLLFGFLKGLIVFTAGNMLALLAVFARIAITGKYSRKEKIPLLFFLVIAVFLEWYIGYSRWIIDLIFY